MESGETRGTILANALGRPALLAALTDVPADVRGAVLGLAALAVSSPWWIYNTVYFGSPMPTSGTAQQDWDVKWLRLENADWALRLVLMPWLFAGAYEAAVAIRIPIPFEPGFMTLSLSGFIRTALLIATTTGVAPMMSALDARRRSCPSMPNSSSRRWRLYRRSCSSFINEKGKPAVSPLRCCAVCGPEGRWLSRPSCSRRPSAARSSPEGPSGS